MSTSGHNSPHFGFNNLDNDREEDRKPSIHQDIVQLDLISGPKMSTSGHNSPHFRFNNLDNDREEDNKPSLRQDIVHWTLFPVLKCPLPAITHLTSGPTMTMKRTANQVFVKI
jgi:hypothetical protein